jgi:two-component system, cell cycle sensor histidine kinase and response regulator CckA
MSSAPLVSSTAPDRRVLLVEDNADHAEMIQTMLRVSQPPWLVEHAGSLAAAREQLRHRSFDAVLLDLGLPDSGGIDTATAVISEFPAIPVVVLSALGDDQTAVEAVRRGAQDFLVKGRVDRDVVVRAVRHAIERKHAERALFASESERKRLEEQLRQSQKMEAVGRLAGGVAHDFNNLLTAMLGYAEITKRHLDPASPLQRNLDEILKAGDKAAALVAQLLAFSRKQVLQPKIINLNAVTLDIEKMLRRVIGEDIRLVTVLDERLGQVRADPSQIEQVILNLAVNARDAMPRGGRLVIETANVDLPASYAKEHVGVTAGAHVMLSVTDTGVGMDAETLSHIFEPFFTTKAPGRGTGLGLATVYGIVAQSGGHVWPYSELGRGTAFKVYFPRLDQPAESPRDESDGSPRGGRERILVVEDEEAVRNLAVEILEEGGYSVLKAISGDEALQVMSEQEVDLVLTDVVMPGMDGLELAATLARTHPRVGVIYMSGYAGEAIRHRGSLPEGAIVIQKPFSARTLGARVREVLDADRSRS